MSKKVNVGQKVKVLNSDWPRVIPVDSVVKVLKVQENGAYLEALGYEDGLYFNYSEFEVFKPGWDTLAEGDTLYDPSGCERSVLGVVGKVIFYSYISSLDELSGQKTNDEMQKRGWAIKGAEAEVEVEEMTVEDVCKALGKEVKIVKSK
jgi:hypothetical protein